MQKAIEVDVEQGSPEWNRLRELRVGSSDASALMEISPWDSAYSIWARKTGLMPPKPVSPAMQRGKDLESVARDLFIKETGILMTPKVFLKDEFMIGSFDGVDFDNKYALEIKCPNTQDHSVALNEMIPEHYKPQLMHLMITLDLPMIYYMSYSENSHVILEVPFEEEYAKTLIDKEKEFHRCLVNLEPPTFTEKDYVTRNDEPFVSRASRYQELVKKRKEIELEEEMIKQELIELAGDTNCQAQNLKLSKVVKKGTIDYKLATKDINVDWERYRKPKSVYWRLS